MKITQSAQLISENGRDGKVESSDSNFSIDFSSEEAGESITPEHLFAAAYAACFHSALKSAAERAHQSIDGSTVTAQVQLGTEDDGGYRLAVELRASVPGVSRSDAEHLLHQAHQTCPYSKATRGDIDVSLDLD